MATAGGPRFATPLRTRWPEGQAWSPARRLGPASRSTADMHNRSRPHLQQWGAPRVRAPLNLARAPPSRVPECRKAAPGKTGVTTAAPGLTKGVTAASSIPTSAPNNMKLRANVAMTNCESVGGGWGAVAAFLCNLARQKPTLISDSERRPIASVNRVAKAGATSSTAVDVNGAAVVHFTSDPLHPVTPELFSVSIADSVGSDLGRLQVIRKADGWKSSAMSSIQR